jgi:hypothetical protein
LHLALAIALALPAHALEASATNGRMTATAYHYTGWAICSLTLDGYQYVDAADHGRCLQSAVSFDWQGEAFNPTEAGSVKDGPTYLPSTTLLYAFQAAGDKMATEVQMAYWQGGLSGHVLRKFLWVGYGGRNIIEHRIAFEPPYSEVHSMGQYEVLTGYMPRGFSHLRSYDPTTKTLAELSDGPGEQALPVVMCTPDDQHCAGVYSPLPLVGGGYGRWRFVDCVKWNMVVRYANPKGVYRFRVFSAYGTLAEVRESMDWLYSTQPR